MFGSVMVMVCVSGEVKMFDSDDVMRLNVYLVYL